MAARKKAHALHAPMTDEQTGPLRTNGNNVPSDDGTAFLPPDDGTVILPPDAKRARRPLPFPIVGIGASAGGLAAFEAFFSGMPADRDPGMAFVLVQHLAPDHKSLLTDLIQRRTRLRVFEVADGMVVRPNCAYIIPPNHDMAFHSGRLHLSEPLTRHGHRLPIDFFFHSLARALHERAICIILSGSGSDGTEGLRAIKAEGGMAMVQKPDSTEYDSMPRSALATGLVDEVLLPAEMPGRLMAHVSGGMHRASVVEDTSARKSAGALPQIHALLRARTGHDFSKYKPSTIQRRIERRMATYLIDSPACYADFLQQHPEEVEALFRDLLIGVTSFFRDPEAFAALAEQAIQRILSRKEADSVVRIWVAGCSTGEEAYSIAMLIQEQLSVLHASCRVQIFATDLDGQAIAAARSGVYPADACEVLSAERLSRFFTYLPESNTYRVNKPIRDMLIFSEQDLIKDPPFSRMDLISCRNLLIYMGSDLQKRLMPLFHYALHPGGFLLLGSSETTGEFNNLFFPIDRKWKLYQRRDDAFSRYAAVGCLVTPPLEQAQGRRMDPVAKRAPEKPNVRELTEQALLQFIVPTGILVNAQGDILYQHGRAGLFLEPAPGEPGVSNILKMAREGLDRELTTALHHSIRTGRKVIHSSVRVCMDGQVTPARLTILPLLPESGSPHAAILPFSTSPLYLVVLETGTAAAEEKPAKPDPHPREGAAPVLPADESAVLIESLRYELTAKEAYLQATREALETSGEELRSSNEEMQSVNEELQSTNEELETSKEELQSINEELATVNAELLSKVTELTNANNDMNNLLAGTGIATIFVDHALRILRFTPAARNIINLIPSDTGRPVSHIVTKLVGYDRLISDIHSVLDTLIPVEINVETEEALWYTLRIQPYRTIDNVIAGAVITFVEITEMKRVWESLQISETRYRQLFEAVREGILIVDADTGTITDVNTHLSTLTGHARDHFIGKPIWETGVFDGIVPDVMAFARLRQKNHHRGEIRQFPTADGRTLHVEFVSNVLEVGSHHAMQCNIRTIPKGKT